MDERNPRETDEIGREQDDDRMAEDREEFEDVDELDDEDEEDIEE
jgi:hypothetical protein